MGDVHGHGAQELVVLRAPREHGLERFEVHVAAQELQRALPEPAHALLADLGIQEIGHAQAHAPRLVGIRGPDPAPGRADAGALRSGFGEPLDRAVVGQDQMGREGHEEAAVHANPLLDQLFPLLAERVAIHDDAISNVAESVRAKDAGRDEMEDEGLIPHDDGVPGVRAALVAGHHVGFLAQEIDDLPFSLVTPLGAYHDAAGHRHHLQTKRPRASALAADGRR